MKNEEQKATHKFIKFPINQMTRSFEHIEDKKQIWDPNKKFVEKAYKNICNMWNKDYKSRGFLKHIIGSFLPITYFNKILLLDPKSKENRCAILGIKLSGISQISKSLTKISMERMFIESKATTEGRDKLTEIEVKQLNDLRRSLPIEHINGSVAYFSVDSTKLMSVEALIALMSFCEMMLIYDDKEMNFTINKKRISQTQENINKNKLNKTEINKVAKAVTYKTTIGDNIDSSTFEALNKLKQQFKEKENDTGK